MYLMYIISIIYKIYDCVMYVFELTNNNTTLNLINIYGTDDNADKILLNLCYVNDIHYIVLNEPDWLYIIKCTVKWNDISYLKNNKERNNNYNNK